MADNKIQFGIAIDASTIASSLSKIQSAFKSTTGDVADMWKQVGATVAETLLNIVSNAAQAGQQTAGQLNKASEAAGNVGSTFAARLPGAIQIAVQLWQVANQIYETIKRLKAEAYNTQHKMDEMALSFDMAAHSIEIANLRLDDNIARLRGHVGRNQVREAILEAKDAADKLIESLEKVLEEENKIIESKVIGGLSEVIFGGGALTEQFKNVTTLMYEWRTAQDKLSAAQNKLLDAKTKKEKDNAQVEVDTAKATADAKLKTYQAAVAGELKAESDKLAFFKAQGPWAGAGLIDDYTKRVALLSQYAHSLEQVERVEKAQDANSKKGQTAAALETRKELDEETSKEIDAEARLAEQRVKTSLAGLGQEKARASVMREDTEVEVDAKIAADKDLVKKEHDIKKGGLDQQLTLLDQWWKKVDQSNKTNSDAYKNRRALFEEQIKELDKDQEAATAKIIDDGERKKADIRAKAIEKQIQDEQKALERRYALQKVQYDNEIELVKSNASRGLITAQEERDQLKAIYDRELQDLKIKVEAQLRLEEQLRRSLAANGFGPGSPEYTASLQRSRQMQDDLNKSTAEFKNLIGQLDTRLKATSLTGKQFAQKLDTDMMNTITQLKVAWQGMIDQMNNGFISSFNKMLETGKGFGQGMIETFGKMAESIIDMFLKIAVEWIESQILMMIFGKTKTQTESEANVAKAASLAAVAASGAFAYYSAIFPPIAEAMASLQYTQGMGWAGMAAFELGGIIPQTGLILAHKGETILPASMSGNGSGLSGVGNNFHVHFNVQAMDGEGVDRVLSKHRKKFSDHFFKEARKKGMMMR